MKVMKIIRVDQDDDDHPLAWFTAEGIGVVPVGEVIELDPTLLYRVVGGDEDLPFRLVPATEQEIHNAAMAIHAAEQDHALGDTR